MSLVNELMEAAQTTRQALDYGDQEWVSGLFVKAAQEIERLERDVSILEESDR